MKKLILFLLLFPTITFANINFDDNIAELKIQREEAFDNTVVLQAISIIPPLIGEKPSSEFNIIEFLGFDWDKCRISQDEASHHTKVGWNMFALDIACALSDYWVVIPSYITGGYTISRIGVDKYLGSYVTVDFWDWFTIVYGHTTTKHKKGDILHKWDLLGYYKPSGFTTWKHFHIELRKGGLNITFDLEHKNANSLKIRKQRGWAEISDNNGEWDVYTFTHYNLWDESQSDSSPCYWALSRANLCVLAEDNYTRPIAITADIRKKLNLKERDKIELKGDKGCEGVYTVLDEMNSRFTNGCIEKNGACIKWDIGLPLWIHINNGVGAGGKCSITKL